MTDETTPKRNQVGLRLGEMLPGSTDNGEPGVPVTGKPACDKTTIQELARVRLSREVGPMAAGNVGTVVHVYPRGKAYEVEFRTGPADHDWHIQTCLPDALEVVDNHG